MRAMCAMCLYAPLGLCGGCAGLNEEREGVRAIAERHLDCPNRIVTRLDVDDGNLLERHWIASCNYQSVRVTCSRRGCSQEVQRVHFLCDFPIAALARADGGVSLPPSSIAAAPHGEGP